MGSGPVKHLCWLTQQIQRRLVAVLRDLVVSYPRAVSAPRAPRPPQPRHPLSWFVLRSQHAPLVWPHYISCLKCDAFCEGYSLSTARSWLQSACLAADMPMDLIRPTQWPSHKPGLIPADCQVRVGGRLLHPSHRLAMYRGLVHCRHCGGYAAHHASKLLRPCGQMSAFGKRQLSLLSRGLLPDKLAEWPASAPAEVRAWITL